MGRRPRHRYGSPRAPIDAAPWPRAATCCSTSTGRAPATSPRSAPDDAVRVFILPPILAELQPPPVHPLPGRPTTVIERRLARAKGEISQLGRLRLRLRQRRLRPQPTPSWPTSITPSACAAPATSGWTSYGHALLKGERLVRPASYLPSTAAWGGGPPAGWWRGRDCGSWSTDIRAAGRHRRSTAGLAWPPRTAFATGAATGCWRLARRGRPAAESLHRRQSRPGRSGRCPRFAQAPRRPASSGWSAASCGAGRRRRR